MQPRRRDDSCLGSTTYDLGSVLNAHGELEKKKRQQQQERKKKKELMFVFLCDDIHSLLGGCLCHTELGLLIALTALTV